MVLGLIIGIIYLFIDIVYWIKWVASFLALWLWKKTHRRRFDLYDYELDNVPEKTGVIVPKEEKILESPLPENQLPGSADGLFFYGVNSKSEVVLIRIMRAPEGMAEAWIYVKFPDGRWLELETPENFQHNFGEKCTSFSCGGLQMYYLSAMRRWRIVYCGMLRERNGPNGAEMKSVFVKFTFIWTASSEIYDGTSDFDIRSAANGMARAQWKSLFPPVNELPDTMNFYAQSGVLNGVVSIEDEPDKEIYAFGEKIRYIGKMSFLKGSKYHTIVGAVPESGLVVHLTKSSIPNIYHDMYYGFIVHPNEHIYAIEDAAIITNSADDQGKTWTAMVKAGKHQIELRGHFVRNGFEVSSKYIAQGTKYEFHEIEFETDGCKGGGFMASAEIAGPPSHMQMTSRILPSVPPPTSNKLPTVYFTDEACDSTDLTGGKGSSLGKLTKLSNKMKSFVVPRGIVVTTVAYEKFLTSEILEKINKLKNVAYGNVKGNVHESCKVVQSAVESAQFPDKIAKEIEEKLNKLFDGKINQLKVAVRSSATGEDTDQMSAAGQMETFLGVHGLKEITTAVKKCWASQFGFIAVEYKRQNGQILNSPMAVVIQEMVQCEAAGVLFTCHPVTNNPSVAVITGNYGLGETVVSGSEEPDTVVLEKLPSGEVKIKSVIIGLKQHKIVMTDTKASEEVGTITQNVSEEEKNRCCISDKVAIQLGTLSLKIENHFKSPRDIEWGIKNNTIYILQSRPITTGANTSDYEIKHEFDGPLRCEKEYFTKGNIGEVMPGAVSTLGFDVATRFFTLAFQKKKTKRRSRNLFQRSKYYPQSFVSFCNHSMLTVSDLITRESDGDDEAGQTMMVGIFGRRLDDPDIYALIKRKKYDPLKNSIALYFDFLKNLFFSGHGMEAIKENVFNYKIPAEKGRTPKEIFDLIVHSCSHIAEPLSKFMICSEMSMYWNNVMMSILAKAKGSIDTDVYSDFSKLLATMSNVESADIPSALQDLANSILKEIKGEDFKAMSIEKVQKWLETSSNAAGIKYRQFLQRHGHRCLKEGDMLSVTWSADPKSLIKLLQDMANSGEDVKEKKEKDLSSILPHLSVKLNLTSRWFLKFVLPNCRRGVREREAGKSSLIKSIDNTRKGFQHLSKTMVAEGYLPDKELLYFMTIDEIEDLIESRNPRIISRANHRRKLYPELDSLLFPEISKGIPVPINENNDKEEIEYVADLTMKGIPVSQGSVKGYARVALSLKEAAELKKGEILIAYSTDIGWSPYFPIIAGVVTELGGLISHGAVVSREYGLPCVVGVHGATRQFLTGDYVLLDGNKGILQRLTPPDK